MIKVAVFGSGFWARFQVAAWMEWAPKVAVVGLCDTDISKARALAERQGIAIYTADAAELIALTNPDVVDIITPVETHEALVKLCADRGIAAICQKPMAPDLDTAIAMVEYCKARGVPFFVHENFRWQVPIRRVRQLLDERHIGRPFKASIRFCSSFPVFDNQPFLAELDQFILTDVGTHILDVARYLFGEPKSLVCHVHRINAGIKGEDVANVLMVMGEGVHCYAEMSYASLLPDERFPETYLQIEGHQGSICLGPGFEIVLTTRNGMQRERVAVPSFAWADPEYALIHSSIYHCHGNILNDLLGKGAAETTASDNLKTLRLVFDAYRSAREETVIHYRT